MPVVVAPAGPADRPHLLALLAAQLAEHDIALDTPGLEQAVDGMLEDPRRGAFLVAREGEEVVGVACLAFIWTLEHGGLSLWLDELYVLPARRGQGIGRALVHATLEEGRRRGCKAVDLEVEASHARVEALYRREGFTPHERRRWVHRLT